MTCTNITLHMLCRDDSIVFVSVYQLHGYPLCGVHMTAVLAEHKALLRHRQAEGYREFDTCRTSVILVYMCTHPPACLGTGSKEKQSRDCGCHNKENYLLPSCAVAVWLVHSEYGQYFVMLLLVLVTQFWGICQEFRTIWMVLYGNSKEQANVLQDTKNDEPNS